MPAQGDQQAGNSPVQGNNAAVSTSEASGPDPATSASISASELPAAASVEPVTQYIVYYTGNPVGTAVAPTVTNAGLPETITFDATATTSFIVDKATVTANHTFKIVQPAAVIFRPKATGTVPLTTSTTQETAPSTTIATSTAAATTSVASVSPTVIKNVRTFYSYDIVTVGNDSKTSHVANPWSSTMLNPQGSTVFILFTESPAATLTATTGGHSNAKRLATLTSTVLPPGAFTQIAAFDLVKSGGGTLSAGAGAGIGIACAIVGALIAFGVFFCFFRRKKSTRSRSRHLSKSPSRYQDNAYNLETKAPSTVTTLAIPHDSGTATVFNNKPQPKEDAFIADEFSRLKSRIDGHVNSYYLRSGGSEKASLDALAHIWSAQSPIQLNRLPGLLADSRSRSHVLRAAIAWVITKRILPNGPLNESFLPAEVSASYAALTNNRMDVNSKSTYFPSLTRIHYFWV